MPGSPTWEQCREAQSACQGRLHKRMDDLFEKVSEIKSIVAREKGRREGGDDRLATGAQEAVPSRSWWDTPLGKMTLSVITSVVVVALFGLVALLVRHGLWKPGG